MKTVYFERECHNPEHILRVTYDYHWDCTIIWRKDIPRLINLLKNFQSSSEEIETK